jgi:hypothetical protein
VTGKVACASPKWLNRDVTLWSAMRPAAGSLLAQVCTIATTAPRNLPGFRETRSCFQRWPGSYNLISTSRARELDAEWMG